MPSRLFSSIAKHASKAPLRPTSTRQPITSIRHLSTEPESPSTTEETKTGWVKYFDVTKQYGFIQPHDHSDAVFVHSNEIKLHPVEGERFTAPLAREMRVKFAVVANSDGKLQARDVTLEDGNFVPPFRDNYLENYIKAQKGRFGQEVFDIMDSVTDQGEMERKIVEAFEGVKRDIGKQREKVERILRVYDQKNGE
jgi:cold shock CspA family protein